MLQKKQFFAMSDYLIFEMLYLLFVMYLLFSICNLYFEGDIIFHFLVLVSVLFAGCDQKKTKEKHLIQAPESTDKARSPHQSPQFPRR